MHPKFVSYHFFANFELLSFSWQRCIIIWQHCIDISLFSFISINAQSSHLSKVNYGNYLISLKPSIPAPVSFRHPSRVFAICLLINVQWSVSLLSSPTIRIKILLTTRIIFCMKRRKQMKKRPWLAHLNKTS